MQGWFLGFWGFDGFIEFSKSQKNNTGALHGWFLGFWGFIEYSKSQRTILEHCKAGFWVLGVLMVL